MRNQKEGLLFLAVLSLCYTLSTTQRIETKRHRVCLEVPDEVVPKDEDEDDDEQYGKRPRLSLIPPRTMSQDGKRNKGIITCTLSY